MIDLLIHTKVRLIKNIGLQKSNKELQIQEMSESIPSFHVVAPQPLRFF
jgi:hypothetical protein